ncbi:centrosomal protein of 70 kDa isoform X4 [Rattus norvegicus]|uniref:Centrosomal protein of 70 kDa n=1 Tax=Rattus norvegicus TaxID=10116 RepID=CEP70_RAT|nr:centrosomal protein of 70 kDa [Rattus norvegicus]XP_006243701.1 centrosomal protein of 70 kDa isoform X4 [Rattus norvegicus]Q5PQQ9.1 RecName: Full=Centrosomal protein of 70 kDa; Short=Cep70 [Rattus norvegicus]AAH87075.1 Centrosomal protein 70kDa [Rattus norvegicus]|eukprot:NP_001017470.1 centrosomal protein of 70 kDa [Rattus norvegicus]
MTEGTQVFLLPISTSDSTKEPLSTVTSQAQDSSLSANRPVTEKQQEEAEWESISRLLVTRGFKPLCLVKGANLRDFIVFDKQSSQRMRQAFKTLMEETTRQQSMLQELIETNHQLKSELQLEQNRAAHQEQRANDLQQIMDSVKSKIGELEDESLNRVCQEQNRIKDLQKEYKTLQMKCQHYKKKQMEQEETIASLQKEIRRFAKEEEDRVITQKRLFTHLCRRVPHSVLDKQQCGEDDSQSEGKDYLNLGVSPTYKGLLTSLQKQLEKSNSKIDVLLGEKLNLQKDLENRPTEHELRLYKQQVKKLEKTLKKNIKLQDLIGQKKSDDMEKKDEPSKDIHQQALVDQRYFQVLCSIDSIVHSPRAPGVIYKQSKERAQNRSKDAVQECGFEHLVPVIEMWADELTSLKDLYKSLKILSAELIPWHNLKKPNENEGVKVGDLLLMVDTMLEEVENQKETSSMPNSQTLQAIVSHFQKLFDVQSLNGVYPRMNEVYARLGEMNNAVRNLQELLGLDSSSSLCMVVSTVGKLCKMINEDVSEQIKRVLGPEDLQSIINKLEEHEEFFPAFQAFTNDLLEILEIDDLDAIVPAVKKLKVLSY